MITKDDTVSQRIWRTLESWRRSTEPIATDTGTLWNISVSQSANKRDIKAMLYAELVKQRILIKPTEAGVAFQTVGFEMLKEIKLKELELKQMI
ncbi:hypothetical protein Baya_14929 [Bagarius yarrelli]|uniref:Uncharacterized protein n=1 Tax=Bagarius yarrelli TaxID=175774 RepID=A0A556VA92_BAGYA|nr:hypothetical protein Baya_14929 [Bagarius yarrelli]